MVVVQDITKEIPQQRRYKASIDEHRNNEDYIEPPKLRDDFEIIHRQMQNYWDKDEKVPTNIMNEYQRLMFTSIAHNEVHSKNASIDDEVEKISTFHIPKKIKEKADYTARVISALAKRANGLDAQEVSMELVSTQLGYIDDIFVSYDQQVGPTFARVSANGTILNGVEADELEAEIIGWHHSHGSMHPFISNIDDNQLYRRLEREAAVHEFGDGEEIRYVLATVNNESGDDWALKVAMIKPLYRVGINGIERINKQCSLMHASNARTKPYLQIEGNDDESLTYTERLALVKQIVQRVSLGDGTPLKEYFPALYQPPMMVEPVIITVPEDPTISDPLMRTMMAKRTVFKKINSPPN